MGPYADLVRGEVSCRTHTTECRSSGEGWQSQSWNLYPRL